MLANVMAPARRVFSTALAALLVTFLVPIAPQQTQAFAAEGGAAFNPIQETSATTGLASKMVFVNHNAAANTPWSQTVDLEKLKAALKDDSAAIKDPVVSTVPTPVTTDAGVKAKEALNAIDLKTEANTAAGNIGQSSKDEVLAAAKSATEKWVTDDLAKGADGSEVYKQAKAAIEKELLDNNVTYKPESLTFQKASGDVTYDYKTINPSLSAASGSVKVTKDDVTKAQVDDVSSFVWALDSFGIASVASKNDSLEISDIAADKLSFKLAAKKVDAAASIDLGYDYTHKVTEYEMTYAGTLDYEYNVAYTFAGWEYTCPFEYSYIKTDDISVTDQPIDVTGTGDEVSGTMPTPETSTYTHPDTIETVTSSVDPELAAQTGTYSNTVSVIDLFPAVGDMNQAHDLTFTYNDAAQTIEKPFAAVAGFADVDEALRILGRPSGITTTQGFKVESVESSSLAGTYGLKVTPLAATPASGETVTVTWKLPDNQTVTHTVTAIVNPLAITFTAPAQDFRTQADNEKHLLEEGNAALVEAIKAATGEDLSGLLGNNAYYKAVGLVNYQSQGAVAQDPGTTWTKNASLSAEAQKTWANYSIADPASVAVAKMATVTWKDSGVSLLAQNGTTETILTADNAVSTWINKRPVASWQNYRLAYATKGVPVDSSAKVFSATQELSGGDGIHSVEMYAINGEDTICAVKGVSYMLDTLKPELISAEASAPQKGNSVFGNTLFGDMKVTVDFALVDKVQQNQSESKDTFAPGGVRSSGVNDGETRASYIDTEHDPSGANPIAASLSKADNASIYTFDIKGDKDVPTSSVKVHAADNAGNVLDTTADKGTIPIEYTRLVADAAAPEIAIDWDTYQVYNGRYYNTNRSMTITIKEAFFNYVIEHANDQVVTTISQNGQAIIAVHPNAFTEVSPNVWQYSLAFTVDADWDVSSPTISDIIGRTASVAGDSFTIDKTAPTMDVAFDNNNARNGMYYNAARTATITVEEHNFNADFVNINPTSSAGNGETMGSPSIGGWSSSGDVHTATVTFPGEGVYSMTIDGADLATNTLASYSCPEFVVDTIKPQVDIALNGEAAGGVKGFNDTIVPQVKVHDTNIDSATQSPVQKIGYSSTGDIGTDPFASSAQQSATATDYTCTFANPAKAIENDGVYTLTVNAIDMAGNTSEDAVSWSVNRFGSSYVIASDTSSMLNGYMQKGKTKDVVVTEYNTTGYQDGSTQNYVVMTKDSTNTTLKRESDYSVAKAGESGQTLLAYTYTVYKRNYENDGMYQFLFSTKDDANNSSESTMENRKVEIGKGRSGDAGIKFAVDNTSPIVSFVNLESNKTYETQQHEASVSIEDGMKLDRAEIVVGNEVVKTLDAKQLEGNKVHDFVLTEQPNGEKVSVKVVAYDAAGNMDQNEVFDVQVTTNPVVLWMNNTPLFIGSIVGGVAAVVLAGVGIATVLRKRKAGKAA